MSFPATIRPEVGPSLITKVSRLFNGTLGDVLLELFQNARRAGARAIHVAVYNLPAGTALSIYDDGCGIDDPANLLTLGDSGWQQDISARERSEEHTSELQSIMRISYVIFCLKKKNQANPKQH